MADFNELCNLISCYKESYSYYYEDAENEAKNNVLDFKQKCQSIKRIINTCKQDVNNGNIKAASRDLEFAKNECEELKEIGSQIRNQDLMLVTGSLMALSAAVNGAFGCAIGVLSGILPSAVKFTKNLFTADGDFSIDDDMDKMTRNYKVGKIGGTVVGAGVGALAAYKKYNAKAIINREIAKIERNISKIEGLVNRAKNKMVQ